MQKILIPLAIAGLLGLGGCSWVPFGNIAHQIDIQQGNIVDQEMIDQLRPGMSRRQVRFIMGSPMLVDTFHGERWEYIYRIHKSGEAPSKKSRVTLFFSADNLARIEGDMHPQPSDGVAVKKTEVIDVPPYDREGKGIIKTIVDTTTFNYFNDDDS
jgi:outer membrane protein assembly factor BamE